MPATRYRTPAALPDGAVLVVGAGPSGQQVALELRASGREVAIAAGRHARMPRRYRGRDAFAWLHAVGQLDVRPDEVRDLVAARQAPGFPLTGARGGESLGLDRLAAAGVVVCGRLSGFAGRHALFADGLAANVAEAEARLRRALASIDRFVEQNGIEAAPADPPPPVPIRSGPASLDLDGYGAIVWATGFRREYPWLHVPVLDAHGEIIQRDGTTPVSGLHTLGLRFQRTRASHLLGGVGADALALAGHLTGSAMARAA